MKLITRFSIALILVLSIYSCKNETSSEGTENSVVLDSIEKLELKQKNEQVLKSLLNKIISNGELKTFSSSLVSAQLTDALKEEGVSYTVFAPSTAAFDNVGRERLRPLFNQEKLPILKALLQNHIIPETLSMNELSAQLQSNDTIQKTTLGGATLSIYSKDGNLIIRDAQGTEASIVESDILANNGSLNIINQVLNLN